MTKGVLAALAVIVALVVVKECGYRAGRAEALANQQDARTDTVLVEVGAAYRDSMKIVRRENARLRAKIAPRDSIVLTDTVIVYANLAGRDSVIVYLDSTQAYLERQIAIRDSLNTVLQKARNQWRAQAQKRLACTAGPSVTAGLDGRVAYGLGLTCGWKL